MAAAEPKYAILGPLRVDGREVALASPKQRLLLAILVVRANRSVPVDTLVELLWPNDPPSRPRKAIAWHILRLRQHLGDRETVAWHHDGYRLRAAEEQIDARLFQAQLRQAAELGDTDPAAADALLRRALELWRGPALSGLAEVPALREEARRLTELHLTALERGGDAALALGRHAALIPALEARIADHPFRERFWAQLMLALHREGRRAEALRVFDDGNARLADHYGLDPSPELRELKRRIETDAVELRRGPAPPRPRQLPADIASFTGRDAEVAALTAVDETDGDGTIVLSAVDGLGGVGKTALAVHAAHRLAKHYPDGQLFVDLRGYSGEAAPVPAAEALERVLRALGVDGDRIPADTDERSALLRSVTAGRRLLLVLDNAVDDAQVRPLLPGGGHRVIVTSRQALPGLDEARQLSLGVLSATAAIALFDRVAGRVEPNRALVAEVVERCGRLPLAVRIAGSLLRHRPHWTLDRLARRLADDTRRLAELRVGDRRLTATFALSLRDLDSARRRAFRLLAAAPFLDFDLATAAAVLGEPVEVAEDLVTALVDARLLENPRPDRYDFHDLVRLYGSGLATDDERNEAAVRLGDWYIDAARAAKHLVARWSPQLEHRSRHEVHVADYDTALSWYDTELANVLGFLRRAPGQARQLWLLADALDGYCYARHRNAEQREAAAIGLAAAVAEGDLGAQASMRGQLGEVLRRSAEYEAALEEQHHALRLAREVGDQHRAQYNLLEIASAHEFQGDTVAAIRYAREAYDATVRHGVGNAIAALDVLGCCHQMRGELRKAAAVDRLSIHRKRLTDSPYVLSTLGNLSIVYCDMGRLDDARAAAVEALRLSRERRAASGIKANLDNLARIECAAGNLDAAVAHATEALRVCEEINAVGSRPYLLATLAAARLPTDPAAARELARTGLELARRQRSATAEAETLVAVAEADLANGDPAAALEAAAQARELAHSREYRLVEGRAVTILAEAALADGEAAVAARLAAEATAIHDRTGARPHRDRALRCRDSALAATG